ncbi:hypothetical protein GCM10009834_08190 [Streptomonospora arabica]
MSAGATYGHRTTPPGAGRQASASPSPEGPHADPEALDAAQNAALASLIRRLAGTRPEIFADIPPAPTPAGPRHAAPPPGAGPWHAAPQSSAAFSSDRPEPEPRRTDRNPDAPGARSAREGATPGPPRRSRRGRGPAPGAWTVSFPQLCATGAAEAVLGAVGALARTVHAVRALGR